MMIMRKLIITLYIVVMGLSLLSCGAQDENQAEVLVGAGDSEVEAADIGESEIAYEEIELWDSARWDFYESYMVEPESCVTYEDCFDILCYIILNDLDEYSFVVENPEYVDGEVQGLIEEDVIQAYKDVTLLLNTYTDFWSGLSVVSEEELNAKDVVVKVTYTFALYHKDGMDNEEVKEKIAEAESACEEIVNAMFADGTLSETMTDKEKAYACYVWICDNVTYAYDSPDADSDEIKKDNFYNAVIEGSAVCQGITGAYIELCRLAGVEMYIQVGYTNGEAHSWCKIEDTDGEWVYIDPTWAISGAHDDETYKDKWFWVTQEFMETYEGHTREFTTYVE